MTGGKPLTLTYEENNDERLDNYARVTALANGGTWGEQGLPSRRPVAFAP